MKQFQVSLQGIEIRGISFGGSYTDIKFKSNNIVIQKFLENSNNKYTMCKQLLWHTTQNSLAYRHYNQIKDP